MIHESPVWHLRLARDDAAAATREAVEHMHDVEAGLMVEPALALRHRRRRAARQRDAFAAWVAEGYAPLRGVS